MLRLRTQITLFLLFITYSAFGQNILKGIVKDKTNQQPMPFVSIAVKDQAKGTVSDEKGNFLIKNFNENDTLIFSYIGYEKLEIVASKYKDSVLYLIPKAIELNEVEIISTSKMKIDKREKIGNGAKGQSIFNGATQYIMWLPNNEKRIGFFESITIDTYSRTYKGVKDDLLIQLRLYDSKDGVPDNEIMNTTINKRIKPSTPIFTFNLKESNIPFLKEGCFIGIEIIGKYDKNENFTAISKEDLINFGIEMTRDDEKKYPTYLKNFGRKWHIIDKFPTKIGGNEWISLRANFKAKVAYYK